MKSTSPIWVEGSEAWGGGTKSRDGGQGWEGVLGMAWERGSLIKSHSWVPAALTAPKLHLGGGMKKELMFSISCPEKRPRERKRWRKESHAMRSAPVPQVPGSFLLVPVSCCSVPSAEERWDLLPCRCRHNQQWRGSRYTTPKYAALA